MESFVTKNTDETRQKGREFASGLKGGEVVCLYGDLGAGKTVFVSGVIDFFLPGKRVLSPTFIIVRHYSTNKEKIKELIHVDLYRLDHENEIERVGLGQYMHRSDSVVLIEWAEKLKTHLPSARTDIKISHTNQHTRTFEIVNYE